MDQGIAALAVIAVNRGPQAGVLILCCFPSTCAAVLGPRDFQITSKRAQGATLKAPLEGLHSSTQAFIGDA